jgi:hypothetical protein
MKQSSKDDLDRLLEEYKAQAVGSGYIDIIVSRSNYRSFAKALIDHGFQIDAVSWWEYVADTNTPNMYGMGGPKSRFYPGWFAEVGGDIDEVQNSGDAESDLDAVVSLVETKVFGIYDGKQIGFQETPSLTPSFWLGVDESWNNVQ